MIKLVFFDFDGVFSEGNIYIFNNEIIKKYNVKDGYGIKLLKEKGILTCIITGFKYNKSVDDICDHLKIDYKYHNVSDKLKCAKRLIDELNISFNETAFMGDDLNDMELLKNVKLSGCPIDAIKEIKEISNFKSSFKGGNGCVRQFSEYIIKYNIKPSITGLICVKYKSNRLPLKNIRKFGNTTLLDIKIKKLLELNYLDNVIVNTESDIILDYIKNNYTNSKLLLIKRDPKFSEDNVENSDFCINVTEKINSEYILYSPVTMPYIEKTTYNNMFDKIKNINFDSIILVADGIQGQGHTNEKHKFCFGASLMKKETILKFKDFIGTKPYFMKCNLKERIDIDYPSDFNIALYHYFNHDSIYGCENKETLKNNALYNIEQLPSAKNKELEIIDVTLRDGGFLNKWNFDIEYVKDILKTSSDIGIKYFEIGYLIDDEYLKHDEGPYRNISDNIIAKLLEEIKPKCKISVLFDSYRFNTINLKEKNKTNIDLIRIVTYFGIDEIKFALKQCFDVHKKGYLVSLNIMCVSYFSDDVFDELYKLIMDNFYYLDFIYLADTFGNMTPDKTKLIFSKLNGIKSVKPNIKIGFHIHNNSQMAMSNFLSSYDYIDIFDVSWKGMGRGAGNIILEYSILYLIIVKKYNLHIKYLLDFIDRKYNNEQLKDIKNSLLGFLNVHPNRIKYSNDKTLYEYFNYLNNLTDKEKILY